MEAGKPGDMDTFSARWSGLLIGMTIASSLVLVAVAVWIPLPPGELVGALVRLTALGVLAGAALFTVRGYELAGSELRIQRLLWSTAVDLGGLQSVGADPAAMRGSIRTFGNGGLFSFSGWYRNKKLGSYRAWVTDHRNAVVLELPGRTLVVSPSEPAAFVERVRQLTGVGAGVRPAS